MTAKEQILQTMNRLPADASIEDAMAELFLLYKVQRGVDQADQGKTVSQEEAKKRMARWLN